MVRKTGEKGKLHQQLLEKLKSVFGRYAGEEDAGLLIPRPRERANSEFKRER